MQSKNKEPNSDYSFHIKGFKIGEIVKKDKINEIQKMILDFLNINQQSQNYAKFDRQESIFRVQHQPIFGYGIKLISQKLSHLQIEEGNNEKWVVEAHDQNNWYLEYIGEKVSNTDNILAYKSKDIIFNENPFELLNFLGYKLFDLNDRTRMQYEGELFKQKNIEVLLYSDRETKSDYIQISIIDEKDENIITLFRAIIQLLEQYVDFSISIDESTFQLSEIQN